MATQYQDLAQLLHQANAETSAAGCHGSLCGALSGGEQKNDRWQGEWLQHVLGQQGNLADPKAVENCATALLKLFKSSRAALEDEELSFNPLLPEESASINQRLIALAQWCDGFLYGFALTGSSQSDSQLSTEGTEILRDFSEIGKLADSEVDDNEVDSTEDEDSENDYAELQEYVRVATMLLFAETQQKTAKKPPANQSARKH